MIQVKFVPWNSLRLRALMGGNVFAMNQQDQQEEISKQRPLDVDTTAMWLRVGTTEQASERGALEMKLNGRAFGA